ncbi:DUF2029 domain-containing protein, partial [Candidatus Bathyarchaeota archaeon]
PIGLENEWYSFYAYLDRHGALPYIDVREGYPPLGFLIYMPIYYLSHGDQTLFFYGFRILNGALLIATTFSLYLTLKSTLCDKKSLKLAMYYSSMPSVIIANAYSNDVVALLPAALGILMITRKKPLSCGVLLGLAALGKGFPALLLIPALIAFKKPTARFKVLCSMFFTLVFASLPFLLVNPFTYNIHLHASRFQRTLGNHMGFHRRVLQSWRSTASLLRQVLLSLQPPESLPRKSL